MDVNDAIKAAVAAAEGKLVDAGWAAQARDPALRTQITAVLQQFLVPPAAAGPPVPPPSLDDVKVELDSIAELLRLQQADAGTEEPVFSVFLGSGAYFGPPQYAAADVAAEYPENVRPPVGSALAQLLAARCDFAKQFPNESVNDWMRVATWYERRLNRGGALGLETQIEHAVQKGKRASKMVEMIAKWPARNFYTTNFDTHLETALLNSGRSAIYVWIYTPKATDLRQCWYVVKKDTPKPEKWQPAWDPAPSGVPPEPPKDATVVFKMHGAVNVDNSMVITEDDYIKFLRRFARQTLPSRLLLGLGKTVVFIGYSLRDFNMRYLLSLLREDRDNNWGAPEISYSVDLRPDPLLKATWQERDNAINFIAHNLWDVIPALQQRLEAVPGGGK